MRYIGMPSKHTLNVSITRHLGDFVSAQVASGRFGTSSEVVRAALRLLERDLNPQATPSGEDITIDSAFSGSAATPKELGSLSKGRTPA